MLVGRTMVAVSCIVFPTASVAMLVGFTMLNVGCIDLSAASRIACSCMIAGSTMLNLNSIGFSTSVRVICSRRRGAMLASLVSWSTRAFRSALLFEPSGGPAPRISSASFSCGRTAYGVASFNTVVERHFVQLLLKPPNSFIHGRLIWGRGLSKPAVMLKADPIYNGRPTRRFLPSAFLISCILRPGGMLSKCTMLILS